MNLLEIAHLPNLLLQSKNHSQLDLLQVHLYAVIQFDSTQYHYLSDKKIELI